jgi:rubredoxin
MNNPAWMCKECGYLYDPAEGDPESSIPAGTQFALLPLAWYCPVCSAVKGQFEILRNQY